MAVVLGIIIGVLFLVVLFILAAEVDLNSRLRRVQERQGTIDRQISIAKDEYERDMRKNNKEIAKELTKLEFNSTCYCFGASGNRVPISEVLFKFMGQLGYTLQGSEFKIIKEGDQGIGKEKTVCKDEKAKKN